jgi:hypothetical protein
MTSDRVSKRVQRLEATQLGSVLLAKDCARDVWIWPWLQSVAQDARFAVRLLVKDPTVLVEPERR